MARIYQPIESTNAKPPLSPKRRRQRGGGIMIIIWAVISLIEGFGSLINKTQNALFFIVATVIFCLAGGFFILLSTKPDIEWENEREIETSATDIDDAKLISIYKQEGEEDPKNKYLE